MSIVLLLQMVGEWDRWGEVDLERCRRGWRGGGYYLVVFVVIFFFNCAFVLCSLMSSVLLF